MLVDVIKPSSAPAEGDETGHWEYVQDPDSGAMVQVWVVDNPDTPEVEGHVIKNVRCLARATGMRPEVWSEEYLNEEWVKLTVAANANITLRDKITNIRTFKGQLIWTEEESDGNPATTFDVFRVSPVIDGFGNVVEKAVLAKRAEVQ
jgi:hypothetical protein